MKRENLVELEGVTFDYGGRPIFSDLNLTIRKGQVVAIMGGSGSGKTTLLRLVSGQLRPQSGKIKVRGRLVPDMSQSDLYALRRRMGFLFQFGALFTDMTVFENVAFPLREHTDLPESMIRDLVLMKLHAVGLRNAATKMPAQLSGGQSRRVALARATVMDPMLVMYDEPFAGLDPISLSVTGNLIRKLNDALGATSILVTHDVHESLLIVDYVYFLSTGGVVAQGTPEEIRSSATPFVHQFVHGDIDGPVPFHYPGSDIDKDLGLERPRA